MIIKITRGSNFAELTNYLIKDRKHDVVDLRGVSSLEFAPEEMARVAERSERTRTVVFHASAAVAIEDGERDDAFWLIVGDALDAEFGFVGHQRVIIRHRDKAYDHVHVFWCAVNASTDQAPPKQWFRRKGSKLLPQVGPRALNPDQVELVPTDQRVRKSYDSFALKRSQHLSRQLEVAYGLRRLRTDTERAAARQQGEHRDRRRTQDRRAERAGSRPLFEQAAALRDALDLGDWNARSSALGRLGVGMKLVIRKGADGVRIRGLVLFDAADAGNTLPASDLDLPDRRYGLRQIEKRQASDELAIEYWWPRKNLEEQHVNHARASVSRPAVEPASDPQIRYREYRARELARQQRVKIERQRIRARQIEEVRRLREALRQVVERVVEGETPQVNAVRRWYESSVVRPALARMRRIHDATVRALRVGRLLTFRQFRDQLVGPENDAVGQHIRDAAPVDRSSSGTSRLPFREAMSAGTEPPDQANIDLFARPRDKGKGR